MAHSNPRSLVHSFTPAADTTGKETVAEIGQGSAFYAEEVEYYVTSDPAAEIEIGLFNGQTLVAPDDDRLTVTQSDMSLRVGSMYDVGDSITLRFTTTASYTGGEITVVVNGKNWDEGV